MQLSKLCEVEAIACVYKLLLNYKKNGLIKSMITAPQI